MSDLLQLVSFELDERLYGLDIRIVKEINPNLDITRVPRARPYIRGLVNIRGQVVLVMDIAVIFGWEPRPVTAESQIVILKTSSELRHAERLYGDLDVSLLGDKPVGFLVDAIGDVNTVPVSDVEPPPPHLNEANSIYCRGIVRLGDGLQIVLNPGALLAGPRNVFRGPARESGATEP
jgi:purine-binding chemotaxis protein CheW